MAKIKCVDTAVVITSELTNAELSKASRYFPDALVLKEKNEDGKFVPVFAVEQSLVGSFGDAGISFPVAPKTCDGEKASLTVTIPKFSKEKKTTYIKDNFGKALMKLNALETAYKAQADKFDKEYAGLEKDIVVE